MTCIVCNGTPYYLGTMGTLDWFRCRNCGMDHYQETLDLFDEHLDPQEEHDHEIQTLD